MSGTSGGIRSRWRLYDPALRRGRTGGRALIALAAALGCAEAGERAAQPLDESAIGDTVLRLENEMNRAVDALDCGAGLVAVGEREPIFVSSGYSINTRSELVDLCAQMVAGRTGAEFDIEDIDAHVLSPEAAYVVRRGDYMINQLDGTADTVFMVMTTVWHREADGWKMVHLHESVQLPQPDSAR